MNDEMEVELREKPWLEPFVEDGDEDLEAVEERWREAVEAAKAELRRLGVTVYTRMKTSSGLETTALLVTPEQR